ncbi:ribosome maturation factor RimM [Actinomyces massiliensis]|uniref:ribosome maturation factor RimM n=1 Tax=Actinomyces massiliensis TaxID=461393 RepID=UPI0028E9EF97|nr:ribosome maturation factor RimM [Actinomyces massiliensis]
MLLTVAVIGPAHALKGEVRLEIRTDDPRGRLAPGARLPVQAPDTHEGRGHGDSDIDHLTVSRVRFDGSRWFALFEEVRDRTAAEALRGAHLLVETDTAGADGAGGADDEDDEAWYAHELIGLRVLRAPASADREPQQLEQPQQLQQFQQLGEVVDLEPGVAQDRLIVRTPEGERVAVPFVEALVPEIDPDAGTVTVDPPGGLFPGVGRAEEDRR